eukprot:gnl/MRDRNA2_/MRDRNA2_73461_c0_seq1.p1 gnl/MRDRNA2_/MRDRNA2_73461_c0~~gnl/MRDRNA2_/MRDRNA2_73461_c0_seq1.p1  ORF type:complete len:107 (-),score=11.08 gnl/MRDRNA2_/MRDRNA2_73461_c0_seq1:59-379(-)
MVQSDVNPDWDTPYRRMAPSQKEKLGPLGIPSQQHGQLGMFFCMIFLLFAGVFLGSHMSLIISPSSNERHYYEPVAVTTPFPQALVLNNSSNIQKVHATHSPPVLL